MDIYARSVGKASSSSSMRSPPVRRVGCRGFMWLGVKTSPSHLQPPVSGHMNIRARTASWLLFSANPPLVAAKISRWTSATHTYRHRSGTVLILTCTNSAFHHSGRRRRRGPGPGPLGLELPLPGAVHQDVSGRSISDLPVCGLRFLQTAGWIATDHWGLSSAVLDYEAHVICRLAVHRPQGYDQTGSVITLARLLLSNIGCLCHGPWTVRTSRQHSLPLGFS